MDTQSAFDDSGDALYPPHALPQPKQLGLLRFFFNFVRNPLEALPEAVYHEPLRANLSPGAKFVWVMAPPLVDKILQGTRGGFPKSEVDRRVLEPLLGDGLLTAEGDDWRWQRQIVAPLFRHKQMLRFVPHMVAAAEETLARWRNAGAGSAQQIDDEMTLATFQVISRTMLYGGEDHVGSSILQLTEDYLRPVAWPIIYGLIGLPRWFPYPGKKSVVHAQEALRSSVAEMIRTRRASLETQDMVGSDDLLARLLQARHPDTGAAMSDTQLLNTLLTFLMAGHETTAKTLTWALYLLARAPQWQERLYREVIEVTRNGPLTGAHIDQLTEVTKVVKEAMRLYPPVPVLSRVAKNDIDIGAHHLKAGTIVVIPIYAVHRHHALWDDPGRFDPDRFDPARERSYPRAQFMPFGAGPRVCVGATFAMIEAVALLAVLLRGARFDVAADHEPTPVARITLCPKGGMPLSVTLRDAT